MLDKPSIALLLFCLADVRRLAATSRGAAVSEPCLQEFGCRPEAVWAEASPQWAPVLPARFLILYA